MKVVINLQTEKVHIAPDPWNARCGVDISDSKKYAIPFDGDIDMVDCERCKILHKMDAKGKG